MRILFVHQGPVSFVLKDLEILRSVHEVREICFTGAKDIFALWKWTLWANLTFSWFGKFHAFFAVLFSKLLGKKAIVVAGGDDVACEPEINYGMFAYWWKKWCPLFVFRHADLILSVSEFNKHELIKNAKADPAKAKLLFHGFDHMKFQPIKYSEKEPLVITVGGVNRECLERKGYERFILSAIYLPNIQFILIGKWYDDAIHYLRSKAPANVSFICEVSNTDLIGLLSRAKVYLQASWHEAFGCALAEAMLCECVPVVTRRAALPEVVGNCGFYVDELSPEALAEQIKMALLSDIGPMARQRIQTIFPLENRREQLLAYIAEIAKS